MDNQENQEAGKQSSERIPFTRLEQVASDFALAITLQEQERAYTMLETIESDTEEDEMDDDDDDSYDADDFINRYEFQADLDQPPEEEDSSTDEDMDDFIPDEEISYEELLALGEFIGEEKRGLSINDIPSCLHPCKCKLVDSKNSIDRCVICQVEYEEGEALFALPCEHPYHSECISKWLQIKKACPICATEVVPPKLARTA